MELLRLIETTERGRKATRGQHAAILEIIAALERGFQVRFVWFGLWDEYARGRGLGD